MVPGPAPARSAPRGRAPPATRPARWEAHVAPDPPAAQPCRCALARRSPRVLLAETWPVQSVALVSTRRKLRPALARPPCRSSGFCVPKLGFRRAQCPIAGRAELVLPAAERPPALGSPSARRIALSSASLAICVGARLVG